jgi:hypothetical protein
MEDEVVHQIQPHTLSFHKNLVLCATRFEMQKMRLQSHSPRLNHPNTPKKSPFTVNWVTPTDHNSRKTMFCCEYMTFAMPSMDFIKLYNIVDSFSSVILSDLKLDAKDQVVPCSFMPAKSLEIHKTC